MSEPARISIERIEAAVDQWIASGGEMLAPVDIAALLKCDEESLPERVERVLGGDDRFFDDGRGSYTLRAAFFRNYEFLITPDSWEIETGALFPGHRFAAYVNPEVFPSEVRLRCRQSGKELALKEITAPLSQVFHYHILLGSEQVFDFFVADAEANAGIAVSQRPTDQVTLHAFDCGALFARHRFIPGDALLCRVIDWADGVIEYEYLSGDARRDADLKSWIATFEDAVAQVVERFENYAEIPEQLAYACFFGRDTLPEVARAASLDEFLRRTTRVEINFDADHTVLAMRQTETDLEPAELPEGLRVSRGETSDLTALLREIGSPLTPVEIESYIYDCCFTRELDFDIFFARAFGRGKLEFTDEGQQAAFYNDIEERFESITGAYNREDDTEKAPLRSLIMELVDDRLAFFDYLASVEKLPEELPQKEFRELAAIALQLDELLKMLNSEGFTPDAGDLARMAETVEIRSIEQEKLIETLSKYE